MSRKTNINELLGDLGTIIPIKYQLFFCFGRWLRLNFGQSHFFLKIKQLLREDVRNKAIMKSMILLIFIDVKIKF